MLDAIRDRLHRGGSIEEHAMKLSDRRFVASVDKFISNCERRLNATVKQASLAMINDMQTPRQEGGSFGVPVDLGNLRRSLTSSLSGDTLEPRYASSGATSYVLAIAQMTGGDILTVGYTANYAVYQEYGTRFMEGRFWVATAAKGWQSYVASAALKARIEIR